MDIDSGEDIRPEPKTKKNDKGFTLIELLIVIVILGVLSTVVVLSVGGITDKGKKVVAEGTFKKMELTKEQAIARAKHEAEEKGTKCDASKITGPQTVYQIMGVGAVVE